MAIEQRRAVAQAAQAARIKVGFACHAGVLGLGVWGAQHPHEHGLPWCSAEVNRYLTCPDRGWCGLSLHPGRSWDSAMLAP